MVLHKGQKYLFQPSTGAWYIYDAKLEASRADLVSRVYGDDVVLSSDIVELPPAEPKVRKPREPRKAALADTIEFAPEELVVDPE